MKRPTLKEVKEYFKDAETVESVFKNDFELGEIYECDGDFLAREKETESSSHTIWMSCKGYAKILTYKNNDMKITKEFIKANADKTLKEVFPEICATVLEVGKWYKTPYCGGSLFCITDLDNLENKHISGYGTESGYGWQGLKKDYWWLDKGITESTDPEIFEALKSECDKLGFKNGVYVDSLCEQEIGIIDLEFKTTYKADKNEFWRGGYCLFKDGEWATIIETITKEEAEKLLNKKII